MCKSSIIGHQSDRMTNPLLNYLHIQRQIEGCPGASVTEKVGKIGGDRMYKPNRRLEVRS